MAAIGGKELPAGFESRTPQEKIQWFNEQGITGSDLIAAGASESDIEWMEGQGFTGAASTMPITEPTRTSQEIATAAGLELPSGWDTFTPEQKISTLNTQGIDESQLQTAGISQSDIDWMKSQGYTGQTSQEIATKAGVNLPSGWDSFTPTQKVSWLNTNNVTPDKLVSAGIPEKDINWMKGQGYTGSPLTATTTTIPASQSTLSPNFSPYVYNMLARGQAAASLPFQPFTGERFAGPSPLQEQAFKGLGSLQLPSEYRAGSELAALAGISAGQLGNYAPGRFANFYQTPVEYKPEEFGNTYQAPVEYKPEEMKTGLGALGSVQDYMSPYTTGVTDIASREARRQADIGRQAEQARLSQAGAYGGSRQAIMESERQRNLQQQMEDITTKGLQSAYDRAQAQRVAESQLGLEAQKGTEQSRQYGYGQGMNAAQLGAQYGLEAQRGSEQSRQYGYGQGMQSAQLGAQYGLEGARQSEQSRQFGANLGLQSLTPMLGAASTLGGLGQQQFGSAISGLQTQMLGGEQQRGLAQQPLDFGYQQFQESVKFPYQQATYMQSLLGGLPLAANPYQANPGQSGMFSALQGGLAGLGLYNALMPK